ncbi:hypothetical protein BH20ACI4_BH20ACI4_15640 [soil metagenome]
MTAKSKLFLIFGGLFLSVFVFIIGSAGYLIFVFIPKSLERTAELNKKRSAETSGTITSLSQFRSDDRDTGQTFNSTFSYQYVVGGVTYNGKKLLDGKDDDGKKQGLKVKVCYDSSDPQSSEFYYLEDNKTCGK